MWKALFRTEGDVSGFVLRILAGVVFFPHGAQKALGWFGGNGLSGTLQYFTQSMGLPWILAALVIAAEFLGSLGLILGFLTRVAAFGIFCVMVGAIITVHWQYGFFMNWQGAQAGEGYEYHLLAIAIMLVLMIRGGGAASVDHLIAPAE